MATKKTGTPEAPNADALQQENAALKTQNDQMLDMLVELKEQVDRLSEAQAAAPAFAPDGLSALEAELNAELDALKHEFKDFALIDVFEQRVVLGHDANTDIRLAGDTPVLEDPTGEGCYWKLRWFNFGMENRAQQAASEGYMKVQWSELQDESMVATGAKIDEWVRRGDRGHDVLHKMPLKLYAYKKKRDAARVQGLLQSERQMRDHVSNRVASMAGRVGDNADQAGTFAQGKIQMSITKGERETVTL